MSRRTSMSVVEWIVLLAVFGVVASIVFPHLPHVQQRAQQQETEEAAPLPADGLDNTIEVSRHAPGTEREGQGAVVGVLTSLLPIVVLTGVVWFVVSASRKRPPRRANQ